MHFKTTLGKDLEIIAERDHRVYQDWNICVSRIYSVDSIGCGTLRFSEGQIKLRNQVSSNDISTHPYIR